MPAYRQPGVYIKQLPGAAPPVQAVATDTAVFLGRCERGPAQKPTPVSGFTEFEALFGTLPRTGGADQEATMGLAVRAFFDNGGRSAVIVRVNRRRGQVPTEGDYRGALAALPECNNLENLLFPGLSWDGERGQAVLEHATAHCEDSPNRLVLIDLPPGLPLRDTEAINRLGLGTSSRAVAYYPWGLEAASTGHRKAVAPVPPSAIAAGVWARTDRQHGVWMAPAGTRATIHGVQALQFDPAGRELGALTARGINALRTLPGRGPRVWGARTLAGAGDTQWRYVPVRRMALFLQQSLHHGTTWAVFEANDEDLWQALRASIEGFMQGLFHQGALRGVKASEAYFVRCGLSQTMTQDDLAAGRVIVQAGFAPLRPAEFLTLTIEHRLGRR